jgi:BirA family biotin operon repressor/biotin-[acetyl-CoA-carboxylase] ligase
MADNSPTPGNVQQFLKEQLQTESFSGSVDCQAILRYGTPFGSVIESHESLPRAMDHARMLIRDSAAANSSLAQGTVILADTMSHCKGRFTRAWHAPYGGVWGCMIHANTLLPQSRRFIPMATGVACCQALQQIGAVGVSLRWVNDVLIESRKLAGFLVESFTEPVYGEEFTLVGFGININNLFFPPELADSAISLRQVMGQDVELSGFTARFLARLAWNIGILYHEEEKELKGEVFSGKGGNHLLLEEWRHLSDTVGKKIVFGFDVMTAPQYRAEVLSVDEGGGLVMRLEDGYVKTEYCGEVRYLS